MSSKQSAHAKTMSTHHGGSRMVPETVILGQPKNRREKRVKERALKKGNTLPCPDKKMR